MMDGLTHWGRVTQICISKLTIIVPDNGLSPGRRQAIIWTNAEILLIRTLGTNFSEILSEIHTFSFNKLEQLERLHSEDTPAASWLPTLLSHVGSHVKTRSNDREDIGQDQKS